MKNRAVPQHAAHRRKAVANALSVESAVAVMDAAVVVGVTDRMGVAVVLAAAVSAVRVPRDVRKDAPKVAMRAVASVLNVESVPIAVRSPSSKVVRSVRPGSLANRGSRGNPENNGNRVASRHLPRPTWPKATMASRYYAMIVRNNAAKDCPRRKAKNAVAVVVAAIAATARVVSHASHVRAVSAGNSRRISRPCSSLLRIPPQRRWLQALHPSQPWPFPTKPYLLLRSLRPLRCKP
jgi:hypothetical protein